MKTNKSPLNPNNYTIDQIMDKLKKAQSKLYRCPRAKSPHCEIVHCLVPLRVGTAPTYRNITKTSISYLKRHDIHILSKFGIPSKSIISVIPIPEKIQYLFLTDNKIKIYLCYFIILYSPDITEYIIKDWVDVDQKWLYK
jgi:hypothetical protein